MRMLDKNSYWGGWVLQPSVAVFLDLGRRRLSKIAAYIRALEPLKPLVSLV